MPEYNISATAELKLGYFIYLLVDPRDSKPFYVGKGKGARCLMHLDAEGPGKKAKRIRVIRKANMEPRVKILVHGLKDDKAALKVEAAVIDLLGLKMLTNSVRGQGTRTYGRRDLHELLAVYNPVRVTIDLPSILIRISKLYRPEMSDIELYDATRGVWKVGGDSTKRKNARYAFAIYRSIVREVYEIAEWLPAGQTFTTRNPRGWRSSNRMEFVGRQADASIRDRFLSKSVAHCFPRGARAPLTYVNC